MLPSPHSLNRYQTPPTTRLTGNLSLTEASLKDPDFHMTCYVLCSSCSVFDLSYLLTATVKMRFHSKITTVNNFSKCILLVFEITIRLALDGMGGLNVFCQQYIGIIETKSIVNGIVKSYVFVLPKGWSWITSIYWQSIITISLSPLTPPSTYVYIKRLKLYRCT